MKKLLLIVLFITVKASLAQSFELVNNDTINYTDANNLRQGFWQILNKIKKLPGYREDQKVEEGRYADSKKTGIWRQFFPTGNPKNEITYANNRPSGHAKMYFENGNIMEEGLWENNRWVGEYKQYYENGKVFYDWKYNTQGKREGDQKYFHPNGNVMIEGNWQEGKENGTIKEYYEDGRLKAEKVFNGGSIDAAASKEYDEKMAPKATTAPVKTEAKETTVKKEEPKTTNVSTTKSAGGVDFLSDGFHKTYNTKKLVDKEGTFKDGKLIDGKQYEYAGTEVVKIHIYQGGKLISTETPKK